MHALVDPLMSTTPGRRLHASYLSWKHARRTGDKVTFAHDGDGWLLEYPDGVLPAGIHKTPTELDRETREFFCTDYTPTTGDVVVDVGAGTGTETLAFSRMVGSTGHVYAIEAHPESFRRLERLIAANRLDNVTPIQRAMSDTVGTITIHDYENIDSHSTVNEASGPGHEVVAETLDLFAARSELDRIDFLKMNIEGAEAPATRGGTAALALTRNVAISCHDFVAEDGRGGDEMRTMEEVRRRLEALGFALRTRDDPRPFMRSYLLGHADRPAG